MMTGVILLLVTAFLAYAEAGTMGPAKFNGFNIINDGSAMSDLERDYIEETINDQGNTAVVSMNKLAGKWWLSYTNGFVDEYMISETGIITIKSKWNRIPRLVTSDNQAVFPSSAGWFKVERVYREASWEYIRLKDDNTLEIKHFCSDGCRETYNGLGEYCCVGTGVKQVITSIGCFKDTRDRAISGGWKVFGGDTIKECYLEAKRAGNEYFAIEANRDCFAEDPNAGKTYNKHGSTSGCKDGRGTNWKMNVYRIAAPRLTVRINQGFVGKWWLAYTNGYKDEYLISGTGEITIKSKWYRRPHLVASDNQIVFPSSSGWYKVEKVYRGSTWEYLRIKDGTLEVRHFCSDDCRGTYEGLRQYCCVGTGIRQGFTSIGCFEDTRDRAISGGWKSFGGNTIKACYLKAKKAGNEYFAIEANTACFAADPNAGETYHKHGSTSGCKDGRGAGWKMNVYRIAGLAAPTISLDVSGSRIKFKCEFTPTDESERIYEVLWYYLMEGKEHKISQEILRSKLHVAFLENTMDFRRFHVGYTVFAKLRSWLPLEDRTIQRLRESNKFYVGFKFEPKVLRLTESGGPTDLKVISTVPIICEDGSTKCRVSVRLVQSTSDILINSCTLMFEATRTFPVSKTVSVMAKRDFVDNGNVQLKITLVVQYLPTVSVEGDWYKPTSPSTVEVTTTSVSGGQCTSTGDPHLRTFDNMFFNHYYVGDYTLVKSTSRNFEVQVRTHRCARVSCNCGVAVREGDDVLIVDMCRNNLSPEPRYASNREPARNTYIERSANGKTYILKFASGAVVKFVAKHWFGRNYYADVTVQVPPDDYTKTEGLCGIFDKDGRNDMSSKGGKVWRNCGRHACPGFTESWRLSQVESLFNYNSVYTGLKCLPSIKSRCMCGRNGAVCGISIAPPLLRQSTRGYTMLVFAGQAECDKLRKTKHGNVTEPGKPTGPSKPTITLPTCKKDCTYPYVPPTTKPTLPTWPTDGGINERDAKDKCNVGITNTELYRVCKKYVEKTMVDGFLGQCVTDIQILDRKGIATAIQAALDAFKEACVDHVTKDPNSWKKVNGTSKPPTEITNVLCPNQCSDKGLCIKGSCHCNEGYVTEDCSMQKGQKPNLIKITTGGVCEKNGDIGCSEVRVISEGLIPGNILCHFQIAGKHVTTTTAELVSFSEIVCEVPVGSCGKAGYADISYKIKLANGKALSDNGLTFRVINHKCSSCDGVDCSQKSGSCVVDGCCYGKDEGNPNNFKCSYCNPKENATGFSSRNTNDCKVHPCAINNGGCVEKCKKTGDTATCVCETAGTMLGNDLKSCVKVHPCAIKNGGCAGKCKKTGDTATCVCETAGTVLGNDLKSCVKGCSRVLCEMHCRNGFDTDRNGCVICKCRSSKRRPYGITSTINIHLAVENLGSAPHLLIRLVMNPMIKHKRFIPENCYATRTMNRYDQNRIYFIRNRYPEIESYIQHLLLPRDFAFSFPAYPIFERRTRTPYVHCICRVCSFNSDRCYFANRGSLMSTFRDQEHDEVEDRFVHVMTRIEDPDSWDR